MTSASWIDQIGLEVARAHARLSDGSQSVAQLQVVAIEAIKKATAYQTDAALGLLRTLIAIDDGARPNGIMDCVDSDGSPYQSTAMAGLIAHARMLAQPYDHDEAMKQYRTGRHG